VGHSLVGVDDDAVADLEGAVGGCLGAEGLDDAGDLEAWVEGCVPDALVGGAVDERQLERLVRGHGGQGREGGGAVEAVARTSAHHLDARAQRRHLGHRHLEAEHAVLDRRPRRLDAHLPTQLVHREICKKTRENCQKISLATFFSVKKSSQEQKQTGETGISFSECSDRFP